MAHESLKIVGKEILLIPLGVIAIAFLVTFSLTAVLMKNLGGGGGGGGGHGGGHKPSGGSHAH